MTKRQINYLGCVGLMVASGIGAVAPSSVAAAPSHAAAVHRVLPGQSIQAAVNAARPGDVIDIARGTYRESVTITTSGLTLRGAGDRTVITPAAGVSRDACARAGNGICVLGKNARPLRDVRVRSLKVTSFKKNGIWASRTDLLRVSGVTVEKNGNWGIAVERSVRGVFQGNVARANAESGIFLSNTTDTEAGALDARRTLVSGNHLAGNRIGLTIRRLRNVVVEGNRITGNCAGVFLVGDEGRPRAGALLVRFNEVGQNNKFCPKTERLPAIQGAGVVLTGVEKTTVDRNVIWGHRASKPASPFSGGVVLFKSIVGSPSSDNTIRDNVLVGNSTPDIANRDTGQGNSFGGNFCRKSEPAGIC
ncbi:right-handed parallel beta-helix repeat-containing protein [Streptomyces sp. NPDC007861]|uniref:right-handed parallel beta-helix repeat-containing protein n=1 Tax=Streptomyces sp. NPDC007861 TaxID=3154893 RepID=UPI0033FA5E27